jgi:hypothetical protein
MNELSAILPCTQPLSLESLAEFVDELAVFLMQLASDVDVIVVMNEGDSCIDEIGDHVHDKYPWLRFRVLMRNGNHRRYGALARFGLAYSQSRYAVLVSPYGEDDLTIIASMLNKARKGAQIVQASRYASPDEPKNVQLRFRLYQTIYRAMIRLFLGLGISDSTYAFKLFDRVYIQALGLSQNGYGISAEITLKGLLAGGKVEYIDSTVSSARKISDFGLFKDGYGYLILLVRGFLHRVGVLWF